MKWLYVTLLAPLLLFADDAVELPTPEPVPEQTIELHADMYRAQFFRTLALVIIFAIGALLLIWFVRRFAKNNQFVTNQRKNIKVLERRQISPNTSLYHIQVGKKQFVLSESKLEVRNLTHLDWSESDTPAN